MVYYWERYLLFRVIHWVIHLVKFYRVAIARYLELGSLNVSSTTSIDTYWEQGTTCSYNSVFLQLIIMSQWYTNYISTSTDKFCSWVMSLIFSIFKTFFLYKLIINEIRQELNLLVWVPKFDGELLHMINPLTPWRTIWSAFRNISICSTFISQAPKITSR